MKRLIVFTDLDGTLLDHETYSFVPARPVLEELRRRNIPVILASSKTAAEIAEIQREAGLVEWPAIVENGAGVVRPTETSDREISDGGSDDEQHKAVLAALGCIDPVLRAKFTGFSDWSEEELAERTGLSLEAASLARRRQFSEPGLFSGTAAERDAFIAALADLGLQVTAGGRFLSISHGCNKAARMKELTGMLMGSDGGDIVTVALGDATNDVEMLEVADIGFIIANPAHDPLPQLAGEREGRITRTELAGPSGWAQAVGGLLAKIG